MAVHSVIGMLHSYKMDPVGLGDVETYGLT